MRKYLLIMLALLLAAPQRASAVDVISPEAHLTLEQCIQIALTYNPNIIAAANNVNVNTSRVGQAQANYYPQVGLTGGYAKTAPVITPGSRAFGNPGQSFDQYSASASLTQNIYDFGKTASQVTIQKYNVESSRGNLENVREQTILNVKQAYYGILQAKRNLDTANESVRDFKRHLEQAQGFFTVGTKPKFDVTTAQVNLSNAELNRIKAGNALQIAKITLNNAMGLPKAPDYTVEDVLSYKKYDVTFDDAVQKAYQNRPDLKSAEAGTRAAIESVTLNEKGYYPFLTGNAAYNWGGDSFPLQHGWNVGATVTIPIFSGFMTKYQVQESKANLDVTKANEETLRQSIFLDVQQAYLNLKNAEEQIPTSELGVKQAAENLELAKGRYNAGVGSPIEITDAESAYVTAETAYNQALYNYKTAQANLEKAMGLK